MDLFTNRLWLSLLASAAVACGATGHETDPGGEAPVAAVVPSNPDTASMAGQALGSRERALEEAEVFVRAQGYADAAPSVPPDEIVHEGIEGTLEDRRDTLIPSPVDATPIDNGWRVRFRYRDPENANLARALDLLEGQRPRFQHRDMFLAMDGGCRPVVSGCGCAYRCGRTTRVVEGRHPIPSRDGHPELNAEVQRWCFDDAGRGTPAPSPPATVAGTARCIDVFFDGTGCGGECSPETRWLECSPRDCGEGS